MIKNTLTGSFWNSQKVLTRSADDSVLKVSKREIGVVAESRIEV
jgi:hypothetical protein